MENVSPMSNTTLHISLPERLKELIDERVKRSGTYSNTSDYVRSLIRADLERMGQEQLEALLLEGLASGEPEPLDFDAIRRKGYARAQSASSNRA
jgi:antitoxin ParD1/3/4